MFDDVSAWLEQARFAVLAVPLVVYFGMLGWLILGHPSLPRAGRPTPELGSESPGVVALLMNRWRVDATAVAATLLDLAARRYIDLDQPGPDPGTTVVRVNRPRDADLSEHERILLRHVTAAAPPGYAVALSALPRVSAAELRAFRRRFSQALRTEARDHRLSTRTPSETWEGFHFMAAMGTSGNAAILLALWLRDWTWWLVGPVTFFALFIALLMLAQAPLAHEWSTPEGRRVASRWRGVRAFLGTTAVFDDLPPAAVTVWDRYLAYAAALGTAPSAVRTLSVVWTPGKRSRGRRGPDIGQAPAGPTAPIPPDRTRRTGQAATHRAAIHRAAAHRAAAARAAADAHSADSRRLLDDLRTGPGVRLGGLVVHGDTVSTPIGRMRRAEVVWTVHERRKTTYRFDPFGVAFMVGLMCLFPINILVMLFTMEERRGGEVTVTASSPDGVYTTAIPFTDGDEYDAISRALADAGARTEPGPRPAPPD